jgi:type IV secretory pathway VirB4 component
VVQGDVGHTIVAGPTGSGKSTLLNVLACQWLRYPQAAVYIFDKGASCRAMTLAMGGDFYDLGGEGEAICFQPLAGIDDESELAWAQEWVLDLLHREKAAITPSTKQELWAALSNLASMPRIQRTLSTLMGIVQDAGIREALRSYTLDGPHGRLLDANQDTLGGDNAAGTRASHPRWQAFEMEHLMQSRAALLPVLTYLFRRLEKRFDGNPTLMILDEAWLYLTESLFAAKIREWLKVLRKKNVAVIFATQSLSDIADSPIAPAIIENCPTRLFLPNGNAMEERTRKVYESFGLNERQLQILQQSIPKRDYYYQSREGNRLFELGLGELALAFCAAGSPQDHARIDAVLREHGPEGFAAAYLQSMGVWQDVFGAADSGYSTTDPGIGLNQDYPADPGAYAGTSDSSLQVMQTRWDHEARRILIENRTVQNDTYRDLAPTAERMSQYVEHSNAASGVTAAMQAGNEELAMLVAQLQALQAQELTDARGEVERDARTQAEEAYAEAQCRAVRAGWDHPPPPTSVLLDAFPLAHQ